MNRMKTLNQLLTDNPNLLSFVVVPTAQAEDLDSATLKTAIIRRCGDVAPYYQKAADFTLFGTMWFNTHSFLFAHALEVWNATYNPIENYDRYETESQTGTKETSGTNRELNDGIDQVALTKEGHMYDRYSGADTKTSRDTKSGNEVHSGTDTTTTSGTRDIEETHSGTDTTTTSGTRDIEETNSGTDTTTTSGSKSGSDAHTGTDTLTDNVVKETEIAGFNSAAYSDANKETETGTHANQHGETITKTEQESGSSATAHGHVVTTDEDTTGSEALAHGHVVTTDEDTTGSEALAHGHRISTDETITNSDTITYGQELDTEYDTTDTTRTTYGKTISNTNEGTEETEAERENHVHGNIGVTTAQQMIDAELQLANKFWIYDYIASAFETDNFITVYDSYYESSAWG